MINEEIALNNDIELIEQEVMPEHVEKYIAIAMQKVKDSGDTEDN